MRRNSTLHFLMVLTLAWAAIALASCQLPVRASRYLLPEGYIGWVRIDFKVAGAPPTPIEDGYSLHKIPPSGILQTSSGYEYGWRSPDEVYYYSGSSRRLLKGGYGEMIQRSFALNDGEKDSEFTFFGTKQDFERYARYENDQPVVGPVLKLPQ